jgi:hypothetical protein
MPWSILLAPVRAACAVARTLVRLLSAVMLAFAGLGPPKPRFIRHEDDIVQVAEPRDVATPQRQ